MSVDSAALINESPMRSQDARVRRRCGGCTLCCRLLPIQHESKSGYTADRVAELVDKIVEHRLAPRSYFANMRPDWDKPAGERCQHQRSCGCAIYGERPFSCRLWNCRWLGGADAGDLSRPDRAGYVIDVMPDFVTLELDGGMTNVEVEQVWIDPRRPEAWRHDKALWAYLERRGREGRAAIIRFNHRDAVVLFPPPMSSDGQWHEVSTMSAGRDHRHDELISGLAECKKVVLAVPGDEP
jgi:hypothetical protein